MIKKIGVLCTYDFPEGMAPTMRIISYGQGLVRNGCKVEVIIFYPKVTNESDSLSGVVNGVEYLYSHKRDPQKTKLHKLLIDRPLALINSIRNLIKSNKKQRFDYILLSFDHPNYLIFFAPILRLCGFRLGFIGDEFPEPIRKHKTTIPLYYKLAYKLAFKFISFRVLMTKALKDFYDKEVCKKPTYILCSILNTDRFSGINRKRVDHRYICYMGNMMLAKDNVDNIIRAFKRICDDFPDIYLFLYGTPNNEDRSVLERLIEGLRLQSRVFIKDRIDYRLVPQTLADAEILVTSQPITKRAAGGFPTKLAEYMMSHTPAIVTNVGEIHNYVQDGNNVYMVEPCDDVSYAEKLKYVLTHPQEAQQVANRAYNYAMKNFASQNVVKGLISFLLELN